MKHALLLALLLPSPAWALDQVDANGPIDCAANSEVFYPRGDSWALLPGGACKGAEPMTGDQALGAPSGSVDPLLDTAGHCLWVGFDRQGPTCKTGCPSDLNDHAERARRTVFAAMRTWSGYKSGDSSFGNPDWYCPSPTQPDMSTLARKTIGDFTFGAGSTAVPTLAFFRAPNVEPTESIDNKTQPNRGEVQECWTECVSSLGDCSTLQALSPQTNPPLYKCPDSLTDFSKVRFRFAKVRNNVVWVKGGQWAQVLGYDDRTLAVTETIYWPDNGVIITSDMLINNESIDWRFGNPDSSGGVRTGCDKGHKNAAGDDDCFDLGTVTLHEAGHFIGLGHINCDGAVMYKSAVADQETFDLSKHEMAGVCSMYRPQAGQGRYPTPSREGEGCLADADCSGSGLKCLLSKSSFYKSAAELQAQPDMAKKIPHRGICVKATQCRSDADCDPTHGRVCHSFDEAGSERYCLPGSPSRPQATAAQVADFCSPCRDGSECISGVCSATQEMGITLSGANTPARICSAKCNLAAGCATGFTCTKVASGAVCVPKDPNRCVDAAVASQVPLDSACNETQRCQSGLSCFSFGTTSVCLEKCNTEKTCSSGYGCFYPFDMQGNQSAEGACFKKEMEEGDNCGRPSTVLCGLQCSGTGGQEVCLPEARQCFIGPRGAEYAQCYALCNTTLACQGKGQTCVSLQDGKTPVTMPGQFGYCSPLVGGTCLRDTSEACDTSADCLSGDCRDFGGGIKACTKPCDLAARSGCPQGAACVNEAGKPLCKPLGAALQGVCGGAVKPGCSCAGTPLSLVDTLALLVAAVWLAQRAMRQRR